MHSAVESAAESTNIKVIQLKLLLIL